MNAVGPVLRDIHVPQAAWWPLAPGWWLVVLAALLAGAGIVLWWRRRGGDAVLATALREIDAMASDDAVARDPARLAESASRLLRRVAVRVQPALASRDDAAWRAFVHAHARDARTRAAIDNLLDARFRARPELDAPALIVALRCWCGSALRWQGRSMPSRRT